MSFVHSGQKKLGMLRNILHGMVLRWNIQGVISRNGLLILNANMKSQSKSLVLPIIGNWIPKVF